MLLEWSGHKTAHAWSHFRKWRVSADHSVPLCISLLHAEWPLFKTWWHYSHRLASVCVLSDSCRLIPFRHAFLSTKSPAFACILNVQSNRCVSVCMQDVFTVLHLCLFTIVLLNTLLCSALKFGDQSVSKPAISIMWHENETKGFL